MTASGVGKVKFMFGKKNNFFLTIKKKKKKWKTATTKYIFCFNSIQHNIKKILLENLRAQRILKKPYTYIKKISVDLLFGIAINHFVKIYLNFNQFFLIKY